MPSIFTADDLGTLRVEQMIFHVVGDEGGVTLFDEIIVPRNLAGTFRQLLTSAARGKKFDWEETAGMPRLLSEINDHEHQREFVGASKIIAGEFHDHHRGNAVKGVLLFADISIRGNRMFLLNKYDEMNVLQYSVEEGEDGQRTASVRDLNRTIVEDEKALQKSILFRGSAEEDSVFIYDRNNRSVANYVRNWLNVRPHFTDEDATATILKALKQTMTRPDIDVRQETHRNWQQNFFDLVDRRHEVDLGDDNNRSAFFAIIFPAETENEAFLDAAQENLRKHNVSDEVARMSPDKVTRPSRKKFRTSEGITVEFRPEDMEVGRVLVERNENGVSTITITTQGEISERDAE